jgi:hypothetical protein
MKSGNLKFLETSGPFQACNGTALPFTIVDCRFTLNTDGPFSLDTSLSNYNSERFKDSKYYNVNIRLALLTG